MKRFMILALFAASSTFADPGIMIDIDIFIDAPSGTGEVEMG